VLDGPSKTASDDGEERVAEESLKEGNGTVFKGVISSTNRLVSTLETGYVTGYYEYMILCE
jgi:hypothetical protein